MIRLFFKCIFILLLFCHFNLLSAQNTPTYNELIASADKYYAKKDYYNAKTTYQLALQLDKNAEYPKNKIAEIIQKLNDELELRIIFEDKIQSAEYAYANKDYQMAIMFYKEATAIIDYEEKPKQEILRIEKEWTDIKSKQNKFDSLIAEAAQYKQLENFVSAILKLEEADKLIPGKSEVLAELAKLNILFKQQNAKIEEFNRLVSEADNRMGQNSFQLALKSYQNAAALFENDSHVKNQLIKVKKAIEIEKNYNTTIEKADAYYIALELDNAKKAYAEAAKIWPEKRYPSNMLAKLDEANKRKSEDVDRISGEYNEKISSADILFNNQQYEQANDIYIDALKLKPEEKYPQNQIIAINALVKNNKEFNDLITNGDLKYSQNKLNDALFDYYKAKNLKPSAKYPQEKIKEIDALIACQNAAEKLYQNLIQKADSLYKLKFWEDAISGYEKVIALKSDEAYPKKRLADAKQFLTVQNELNASYKKVIDKADSLFESQSLTEARKAYLEANRLKPNEQYPLYKIEDINTIIEQKDIRKINSRYLELVTSADKLFLEKSFRLSLTQYKQALALKPNELYPPQQITKIEQIIAVQNELDIKYNSFIKSADSAFYLKKLDFARKVYIQAKELKPLEDYPPSQISKIDGLLAYIITDRNYQGAVTIADSSFADIKYNVAKVYYNLALTYKPSEAYPKLKIKEIDALLAQMNTLDAEYQKAIRDGDLNFDSKKYLIAISNFKDALKLKANEEYPKIKIEAIELILADNELNKNYNQALSEADKLFDIKQYIDALSLYKKAKSIKPDEKYPQDQILKIQDLLGAIDREYQSYIKQGDDAYRLVIFQDAILAYENALRIYPKEPYPRAMLDKIDAQIKKESVLTLVSAPEIILAGKEKRYTFKPIIYRDRLNNYILIEMKNSQEDRLRVFINFGQDEMKNGGYSVFLMQRDGYTKYFVRIDRQLRWQNIDNNWISILPEGGDLEVNMIQISRNEKSN